MVFLSNYIVVVIKKINTNITLARINKMNKKNISNE